MVLIATGGGAADLALDGGIALMDLALLAGVGFAEELLVPGRLALGEA